MTLTAICAFGGITPVSISNGHLEDTVPLTGSQDQTGITPQVPFRKKGLTISNSCCRSERAWAAKNCGNVIKISSATKTK